jgi:hypothetical protein
VKAHVRVQFGQHADLDPKAACALIDRHETLLALRNCSCSSSSMLTMPIAAPEYTIRI